MKLENFVRGSWVEGAGAGSAILDAVTGRQIFSASTEGTDYAGMLAFAREVGGANLRRLTFIKRAEILKAVAAYVGERKEALYELSFATGATRRDAEIDIDGGLGTVFYYASKARRSLPDDVILADGELERLSKGGNFVGRHVLTSRRGVALFVNAFNFPCWGLLEKFAPAFIAGMPVVIKPATVTSYLTQALVRLMTESGLLPEGSLQVLCGGVGDMFDHLGGQDVVSFTGSAATAAKLRAHPAVVGNSVRFIAECDSLNATILGPDISPDRPEFQSFVKEVVREMTVKAGQKCTAIRRILVPRAHAGAVAEAVKATLETVVVGDPRRDDVRMGALVGLDQRGDVLRQLDRLRSETQLVTGEGVRPVGADAESGAFMAPVLLRCKDSAAARLVHEVEAFGPVSTVLPYVDFDDALALANRGGGSLVSSLFTGDPAIARQAVLGAGAYHGRLLLLDAVSARESTGHGSPLPQLIHGGPGRAGGGEEMGGLLGIEHYMQRSAVQGSPTQLAAVTGSWVRGAPQITHAAHPFTRDFGTLEIGETVLTPTRLITVEDIEHFAHFTGDLFYAHMDEEAAAANPFFPGRVAHGYLLLSFAAGLFVDPSPGPVLANYGLDTLRFLKPVSPGDSIRARLTVKDKSARNPDYGEVRWDVELFNQTDETVATYELLTMNAR